jgi:hypothetical protein
MLAAVEQARGGGRMEWMRGWVVVPVLAGVALLMALVSYVAGMQQYAGYDASMMVNLAYRLAIGQGAPQDFFSPMPPLFSLGSKAAFEWLGVRWSSLVWAGSVSYAVLCALIILVGRRLAGLPMAVLVGATSFALTGPVFGFWWHNPLAGLLGALACLLFVEADRNRLTLAGFGIALGALLASKPNLAVPVCAVLVAAMFLPRAYGGMERRAALWVIAACALVFVAICVASGQGPLDYWHSVAQIAEKRSGVIVFWHEPQSWDTPLRVARSVSFLALALAVGAIGLRMLSLAESWRQAHARSSSPGPQAFRRALAAIAAVAGTVPALLFNGDWYHPSLPCLLGVLLLMAPAEAAPLRKGQLTRATAVLSAVLLAILAWISAADGLERARVFTTGPKMFWEPQERLARIDGGFFDGMAAGPILSGFLREAGAATAALRPKHAFFGPRVEFGYASFGLEPPKGVPLWMDPAAAWPQGDEQRMAALFAKGELEVLFFLDARRPDVTYMPRPVLEEIVRRYVNVTGMFGFEHCTVLVRRDIAERIRVEAPNQPLKR